MKNPNRREFIKITGKTLLVTSGISVFGLATFPEKLHGEDGPLNDGYFLDGYYSDGYYYDGYYNDGYTSGINSYQPDLLQMEVLPNPSNGNFELQLTAKTSGMAEVFITDLIGRTMMRETHELTQGANQLNFRAEQLAKGVYYLSVITTKGTGSVRVVVVK